MNIPFSIVHTVSSVDQEASGPSYSVPSLVAALQRAGQDAEVVALGDGELRTVLGATVVTCPRDGIQPRMLMRLGRSRAMRDYLLKSRAGIFHSHGLWMMPNVYPAEVARRLGKPFILAPRGMLGRDALKFSKTTKRLFWAFWQKRAVEAVSCFHATAESEYQDIRAFGLTQPVAIIPNGIDLPVLSALDYSDEAPFEPAGTQFILSLGRIHPKKGLDRLIAAFALLAAEHPGWRLRIVGPDEGGYARDLVRQVTALGLSEQVSIEPPVFGVDKFRLMRHAALFGLPTLHENFGMTVAESLAVETPVVSTKGAPWSGLVEHRCGWWIDHGTEAMAKALKFAMSMPESERREMGVRGREWMARDFSWQSMAEKSLQTYAWVLGRGERPDCVALD